ncbi:mannosyl-oligosaccharide alpha-1,2-mannosidase IA-like [Lycorma delicatula]|uniref:mannosyl-oligosaccharide alpha-1,2-mannosidase IA-like n=1 Tax=Lycorma delicatula TaxID=130591 RepID=UPI003F50EC32
MHQRTLKTLRFILVLAVVCCTLMILTVFKSESSYYDVSEVRKNRFTRGTTNLEYEVPEPLNLDNTTLQRRNKTVEMMKHAWNNYVRYAWGENELRPVSKSGNTATAFGLAKLGVTIIDALDTLYIMGLHEEFNQGRDWIANNLNLKDMNVYLSVFEVNIRIVGGLLSCFALTGDVMFKQKAELVAQKLLPAFETDTGIPHSSINIETGHSKNYPWVSGGASILAEFGSLHLEFTYLSDVTGVSVYKTKVNNIRAFVKSLGKLRGLYPNFLNPETGRWGQFHVSLGAMGDSFYEYLLKSWIQSGKEDKEGRHMYDDAMQAAITQMLCTSSPSGLLYFGDFILNIVEHKMDHLACYNGGLLSLAANTLKNYYMSNRYMEIAAGITNTCHESYIRAKTHLGPESFRFTEKNEATTNRFEEKHYILRPETVESYFYMWRFTKNEKYREWGWDFVEALEKYCRVQGGFSGIRNVYHENPIEDDEQQSFFLAETLKYLYLLYSDDNLLPLDEWVFNTEAHPLPIRGSSFYRENSS